ncbi:unnamed protein product [marine sediment metagenome]|uniref:Uncharacterized protein n=1 Tax=marine sediment metagenome TaxID=412755 RepID=X1DHF6_9ZZZZ
MLTAMQMGYFKDDLKAVLEEVVIREAIMETDASCTATISMSEPMKVEFTFVAIFEKKDKEGKL